MIDYKLALELKDAGFPMPTYGGDSDFEVLRDKQTGEAWSYPTLEELIEACGKEFRGIEIGDWEPVMWYAKKKGNENDVIVQGSTPTIAVAKLWLALHKK